MKGGRKRSFDSAGIVVDGLRRLRIEAYGPLGQPVMALVWDGREILLRLPGEDAAGRTGPAGLERLLGAGLEPSELCAVLSGNVPAGGEHAAAMLLCAPSGDCVLELRQGDARRLVRVSAPSPGPDQGPRILSYERYQSDKLLFQARFDGFAEISHYRLPMQIVIGSPDKDLQVTVLYSDADVNTLIGDDAFILTDGTGTGDGRE